MKIIFLDIDGVLNSEHWYRIRPEEPRKSNDFFVRKSNEFDPEAVKRLNKITEKTNAKIVISSSWRPYNDSDSNEDWARLKELLIYVGVTGEIIGYTPRLKFSNSVKSVPRGCEIDEWIYQHETPDDPITEYVIFDDDSDMLFSQRNRFLKTSWAIGLQEIQIQQALYILRGDIEIE